MKTSHKAQARQLIQWYVEGSDLDDEQLHILHDTASEHGQILDNVVRTQGFLNALTENLWALDCF